LAYSDLCNNFSLIIEEFGICRKGKMIIRDFEPRHTEEAAEIALDVYNYERSFTQELPEISSIPILKKYISGVSARNLML